VVSETTKTEPKKDASDLPIGWKRVITQRKSGVTAGMFDCYIYRLALVKYCTAFPGRGEHSNA